MSSFCVETNNPLHFETGGTKSSTNTAEFIGDKAGEGMAYMLKNCPYVCSLGKLIQKGFNFICGPDPEPTLVPPDVPFNVTGDKDGCHAADPVDHCVPIFRETISFTYGMPAASPSVEHSRLPAPDAEAPGGDVVTVPDDGIESPNTEKKVRRLPDDVLIKSPEGPHGDGSHMSQDISGIHDLEPVPHSPKVEQLIICLRICHPNRDVCTEAKLRTKTRKRLPNQKPSLKEARAIETANHSLQKI